MKYEKKFQSQQAEQQVQNTHEELQQNSREFAHADELLRHDSLHTPVPPSLAHRIRDSIRRTPEKPRPWWRRLFGS